MPECPDCNGVGTIDDPTRTNDGRRVWLCETCNGSGDHEAPNPPEIADVPTPPAPGASVPPE